MGLYTKLGIKAYVLLNTRNGLQEILKLLWLSSPWLTHAMVSRCLTHATVCRRFWSSLVLCSVGRDLWWRDREELVVLLCFPVIPELQTVHRVDRSAIPALLAPNSWEAELAPLWERLRDASLLFSLGMMIVFEEFLNHYAQLFTNGYTLKKISAPPLTTITA